MVLICNFALAESGREEINFALAEDGDGVPLLFDMLTAQPPECITHAVLKALEDISRSPAAGEILHSRGIADICIVGDYALVNSDIKDMVRRVILNVAWNHQSVSRGQTDFQVLQMIAEQGGWPYIVNSARGMLCPAVYTTYDFFGCLS